MRKLFAALVVALVVVASQALPASGSSFTIGCAYDHSRQADPIVSPGVYPSAHLHDFFGNKTTDENSTLSSMQAGGTSCGNSGDLAGYWTPSVYLNGTQIKPNSVTAYYYRKTTGTLTPFPLGLQMIAGDSHATAAQSKSVVYWGCGSGSGLSKVSAPPNCTGYGSLKIHILFPYCASSDGTSLGYVCDSAHPVHYPQLVIRENFSLVDAHAITLASGAYYTEHADYWSVWKSGVLEGLVSKL